MESGLSIADFRWLVSANASPYLERAAAESGQLVRLAGSLRRELSAQRTHLVLEQVALRARGAEKFSRASQMFFAPTLLEQASEERIAFYKAQRFTPGSLVLDLCCGLGGDSIGIGSRGPVQGIDRDPLATLLAQANNAVYGNSEFTTRVANAAEVVDQYFGYWHLDPDRRPEGYRTTQVELFEPSVEVIEALRGRQPNGAIKLASATATPDSWQMESEREWIGSRRECRQQVAWLGSLASFPGMHRATVVESDGGAATMAGQPSSSMAIAGSIGRFLFEPHPAVLAAQLAANLAAQHNLGFLAERIAYLTGDQPLEHPLLSCFEVVEVLPFDLRQLRAALTARNIGRLEIKARGVDVDPISLRKKLRPRGEEELTLLIAGPQTNVRAVLAKRR